MATITLKNVPENVHGLLKKEARLHKRSLNQQVIYLIEQSLSTTGKRDVEAVIRDIRALRSRVHMKPVSTESIDKARREGRM